MFTVVVDRPRRATSRDYPVFLILSAAELCVQYVQPPDQLPCVEVRFQVETLGIPGNPHDKLGESNAVPVSVISFEGSPKKIATHPPTRQSTGSNSGGVVE